MPASPSSPRTPLRAFLRSREFGVLVILLAFIAVLEVTSRVKRGETFWTPANLPRILQMYGYMTIAAVGAAVVLIAGGVDLSSGSVYGLGAVVTLYVFSVPDAGTGREPGLGWPPLAAIALAAAAGAAVGAVNGFIVAKVRITPFIVTLAMMLVARALQWWLCGGRNFSFTEQEEPGLFRFLSSGTAAEGKAMVPGAAWLLLAAAAACAVLLAKFKWGRSVYAVGGNEEVARHSGIPVDRVKVVVYVLAGALAALAGSLGSMCSGYAGADTGKSYELQFIAGAVVGGTSLSGGRGSVVGAALGAGVLQLLRELLLLYSVGSYMQDLTYGVLILAVAAFDEWRTRGGFRALGRLFRRGR